MLKQRVLTIGGGCPQSCTFCASRKTPSFSRPSHATYDLLRSLSDNSPRDRFYVDLLHADPLADKSYHAASEYASMFTTVSPLKSVTRIQTRLALLKNYDPSFFASLNTRLIYVGLETIDDFVSKKSKNTTIALKNLSIFLLSLLLKVFTFELTLLLVCLTNLMITLNVYIGGPLKTQH